MELTMDPSLPKLFAILLIIFFASLIFLHFKQPVLIAYILTGIVIGPYGFGIIENVKLVNWLGNIGVVLLLFFLGMDIPLPHLITNWKTSIIGTFLQIVGSVAAVMLLGLWLNWSFPRILLPGFVLSLSSTSIIIRLLSQSNRANTKIGNNVMGITLTQNLAVVPMFINIGFFRGEVFRYTLILK